MKDYALLSELAKLSGTNANTIKTYVHKDLIISFVGKRPKRYKVDETLKRLKEIAELKERGYSLEMIKEEFNKRHKKK